MKSLNAIADVSFSPLTLEKNEALGSSRYQWLGRYVEILESANENDFFSAKQRINILSFQLGDKINEFDVKTYVKSSLRTENLFRIKLLAELVWRIYQPILSNREEAVLRILENFSGHDTFLGEIYKIVASLDPEVLFNVYPKYPIANEKIRSELLFLTTKVNPILSWERYKTLGVSDDDTSYDELLVSIAEIDPTFVCRQIQTFFLTDPKTLGRVAMKCAVSSSDLFCRTVGQFNLEDPDEIEKIIIETIVWNIDGFCKYIGNFPLHKLSEKQRLNIVDVIFEKKTECIPEVIEYFDVEDEFQRRNLAIKVALKRADLVCDYLASFRINDPYFESWCVKKWIEQDPYSFCNAFANNSDNDVEEGVIQCILEASPGALCRFIDKFNIQDQKLLDRIALQCSKDPDTVCLLIKSFSKFGPISERVRGEIVLNMMSNFANFVTDHFEMFNVKDPSIIRQLVTHLAGYNAHLLIKFMNKYHFDDRELLIEAAKINAGCIYEYFNSCDEDNETLSVIKRDLLRLWAIQSPEMLCNQITTLSISDHEDYFFIAQSAVKSGHRATQIFLDNILLFQLSQSELAGLLIEVSSQLPLSVHLLLVNRTVSLDPEARLAIAEKIIECDVSLVCENIDLYQGSLAINLDLVKKCIKKNARVFCEEYPLHRIRDKSFTYQVVGWIADENAKLVLQYFQDEFNKSGYLWKKVILEAFNEDSDRVEIAAGFISKQNFPEESERLELVNHLVLVNPEIVCRRLDSFGLESSVHLKAIVKILLRRSPVILFKYQKKFGLSEKQRVELLICLARECPWFISDHPECLDGIESAERIEIALEFAASVPAYVYQERNMLGLNDPIVKFKILSLWIRQDPLGFCNVLKAGGEGFSFLSSKELKQLALCGAESKASTIYFHRTLFEIVQGSAEEKSIVKSYARENPMDFSESKSIDFSMWDQQERAELALMMIAKIKSFFLVYAKLKISDEKLVLNISKRFIERHPEELSLMFNFNIKNEFDRVQVLLSGLKHEPSLISNPDRILKNLNINTEAWAFIDLYAQIEDEFGVVDQHKLIKKVQLFCENFHLKRLEKALNTLLNKFEYLKQITDEEKKGGGAREINKRLFWLMYTASKMSITFDLRPSDEEELLAWDLVSQYRDADLRYLFSDLILTLLSNEDAWKLYKKIIRREGGDPIKHVRLPALFLAYLGQYFCDEKVLNWEKRLMACKDAIEKIREFHDAVSLKILLDVLSRLINEETMTGEESLKLLETILKDKDFEEVKSTIHLLQGIIDSNGIIDSCGISCIKKMLFEKNELALGGIYLEIIQKMMTVRKIDDFERKYIHTIGAQRNASSVLTFIGRCNKLLNSERATALSYFSQYLEWVLNENFSTNRYNYEHVQSLFKAAPGLEDRWIKGETIKVSDYIARQDKFECVDDDRKKLLDSYGECYLVDTDDFWHLFMCGTEVDNSCLKINSNLKELRCLLNVLLDGKIRIAIMINEQKQIIGRRMIRLMKNNQRTVLFREGLYVRGQGQPQRSLLESFTKDRASKLGLMLFEKGADPVVLESFGSAAPWEYVDGAGNQFNGTGSEFSWGKYQINFASLVK